MGLINVVYESVANGKITIVCGPMADGNWPVVVVNYGRWE